MVYSGILSITPSSINACVWGVGENIINRLGFFHLLQNIFFLSPKAFFSRIFHFVCKKVKKGRSSTLESFLSRLLSRDTFFSDRVTLFFPSQLRGDHRPELRDLAALAALRLLLVRRGVGHQPRRDLLQGVVLLLVGGPALDHQVLLVVAGRERGGGGGGLVGAVAGAAGRDLGLGDAAAGGGGGGRGRGHGGEGAGHGAVGGEGGLLERDFYYISCFTCT